jgi:Ca2+-transporting ATPase
VLVGIFLYLSGKGTDITITRTIVFSLLAINSLMYSFSCKNLRKNIWEINIFSNRLLVVASIFGFIALLAAIYVPALNVILGTTPISLSFWPIIFGLAAVDMILIEAAKFYFIKNKLTE